MNITHDEVKLEKISGVSPAEHEDRNQKTVKMVYKALRGGDTEKLEKLVGKELEWWYHGPPQCHHMMKALTGESTHKGGFEFRPRRMRAIGDRVIVEGWEGIGEYWVHAWGLKEGVISQLREYFNTLVTVVVRVSEDGGDEARSWRSTPWARAQGALPDLVLAI